MPKNIAFYHVSAKALDQQYSSVSFENVHESWKEFWPKNPCSVLDIGAGNGRDARWFNQQQCDVVAVEPAAALLALAKAQSSKQIHWMDDHLPALSKVYALGVRFDVILVSAVWMHLTSNERERSFRKLANLLAPNGLLVISLRHGEFNDPRTAFPVSVEELQDFATRFALTQAHCSGKIVDKLGRGEVQWQTLVFRMPDDGSGSLAKIRKIIVNDNKTSTYKLALLRTLCRIADAHPGAVIDRSDGKLVLPLGLVALHWIRLYKRLLDPHNLQQTTNSNKGVGFVKTGGWNKLTHIGADDLAIGALFIGDDAVALHQLIKDTIHTIDKGPVSFIYHGAKINTLFQIKKKPLQPNTVLLLDKHTLCEYGEFIIDENLWNCFREYGSWIDPLLVQQWIREMQTYTRNKENQVSLQTYHEGLILLDGTRNTNAVRDKVKQLNVQGNTVTSAWSDTRLIDQFHVDHCLPFSYWPNNDKWNLLPSTEKENLSKSDKIPSKQRLGSSKNRILEWWQLAWTSEIDRPRFFHEANLSLPNVSENAEDLEEVFEAMQFQIFGVKQRLQVAEW